MLDVVAGPARRDCEGRSRRDFLQAGTLALGSLGLPWLLEQRARAAGRGRFVRPRSVVLLFLSGGASHIETFNPNMSGPGSSRSTTGEVPTTVPGMTFGGTFPQLARHAHRMAVVRSFQHPIGGHVQAIVHVLTGGTDPDGRRSRGYSIGSMYARLRGANHPTTGIPTYALLNSEEVDPQYRNEHRRVESGSHAGSLGVPFAPFIPGSDGPSIENMQLSLEAERLDDRRALLDGLDGFKRRVDRAGAYAGADRFTQQAFDVLLGNASEAFDLTREPPHVRARYDTSQVQVGKKVFRASQLGNHLLTARRLVESGCGFVTVHSAGWDMHADSNNPGIVRGMEMLGRPVDKAVSAFLEDLDQRGMLDDVLLVITGDFGRTPKVNGRGGRDHWPKLCTLAFAGGGVGQGQIIGQSTRRNDAPASDAIDTRQLMATVLHWLFDVGELRVTRGVPRELLAQLERHRPIPGLG